MDSIKTIGFIMDGNRRWAKERNLPTLEGHRKGYEKLKDVLDWCKEADVKNLVVYGFSTENWRRSAEEVGYLMDLFEWALTNEFQKIMDENVQIRFVGERTRFSSKIKELMDRVEEVSATKTGGSLILAVSYGGRAEIVAAAEAAAKKGGPITEESFAEALWTAGIPDPDIVVRTGGEKRLSNFLPWQSTYSELFFSDTLWPDYTKEEFDALFPEYADRRRNFGK